MFGNKTIERIVRVGVAAAFLVVTVTTPALAQRKNSDVDNIGNRDVNTGGALGGIFSDWNFTSLEEEIALGRELSAEVERQVKFVDDPVITEYVNRVGQNLVRNSDAQVPFTFRVIEDDSINAFALPGGFVFINTGILTTADEEAEFAGVLSHEIAHVTARHGTENATKNQVLNLATLPLIFLGGIAGFAVRQAASIAIPMQYMQFTRGAEKEADYLGAQYAYKAGYDPGAAVTFFEKVQARETAKPGTMNSLFATHPPTEDRIEEVQVTIENVLPERDRHVLTTSEFLDVQERLSEYLNSRPADEEDDRPSLRRRTPRVDTSDSEDIEDDERPRIERRDDDPDREPEEDDRPVLRRTPE